MADVVKVAVRAKLSSGRGDSGKDVVAAAAGRKVFCIRINVFLCIHVSHSIAARTISPAH